MDDKDYRTIQKRRLLTERGKTLFEWLRDIGNEYIGNGTFPISLADYYTEKEDVEIASVVETLIPDSMSVSSFKRQCYITELHNLLGGMPSRMITERSFLHILPGKGLEGILGKSTGVQKSDLFNVLDWIWEVKESRQMPLELAFGVNAGVIDGKSMEIPNLGERLSRNLNQSTVCMALMRLCTNHGVGRGVWSSIDPVDIPCPMCTESKTLLRYFYPIGAVDEGNVNEILSYMGFDVPSDFVYSYFALWDKVGALGGMSEKLRNVMEGGISLKTWHKYYKDGVLFTPEYRERLEKERERVRKKMREMRGRK